MVEICFLKHASKTWSEGSKQEITATLLQHVKITSILTDPHGKHEGGYLQHMCMLATFSGWNSINCCQ